MPIDFIATNFPIIKTTTSNVKFRLMKRGDLDKLPWSKRTQVIPNLARLIDARERGMNLLISFPLAQHAIVAEDTNGRISGMISFGRDESDGSGFLEWIWVHEIYRRKGIARRLMTSLKKYLKDCKEISLQAFPKAIPFFVEMGYVRLMNAPDGTILMKKFIKKFD